jgi:DNA-binding FadR family transcriptional regulator
MTRKADPPRITRTEEGQGNAFSKVFAFLRDRLLEGSIRSGDQLIPERELAAQLGVSRPILREALRALSMMGVVEIRSRVGTVVRQPDISVLGDFFALSLAQHADVVEDVMQARIAIECQAIRLACQRAVTSDFDRLSEALAHLEATIEDPDLGGRADFEFHTQIVRAARSDTLTSLYVAMRDLLLRSHRDRRVRVRLDRAVKQHLVADHRRIFDAIAGRDEDKADQVLRRHFSIGDENLQKAAIDATRPRGRTTDAGRPQPRGRL